MRIAGAGGQYGYHGWWGGGSSGVRHRDRVPHPCPCPNTEGGAAVSGSSPRHTHQIPPEWRFKLHPDRQNGRVSLRIGLWRTIGLLSVVRDERARSRRGEPYFNRYAVVKK